jgi:hypothetical protein
VTALVVSDLHLGARSGIDLARSQAPVQQALLEAAREAEELVLLGDTLELREGPLHEAMSAARPCLEALGEAVGTGRIVLMPGNHDHRLLDRWRERRDGQPALEPLAPEQLIEPDEASEAAAEIAGWLAPARVEVAYPGLWLAPGVYATHGHYLDRHVTVPGFEPLAIHGVERVLRTRGDRLEGVEGYEAVLAPVYGLIHELVQSAPAPPGQSRPTASITARAYRVLADDGRGRRPLTHRLLGDVAFPGLVAALNAVGMGPLRADLSGPELRRAALKAMGQVIGRLEIKAEHVIFGHTHRTGPLPGDDPAEWLLAGGGRLHNCGSWVIERFLGGPTPQHSPYRAGGAILVDQDGPPRLRFLLDGIPYSPSRPAGTGP